MKILFVIGNLSGCGGTERVTSEMASAFAEGGHDVAVLSLFGPAEPYFQLDSRVTREGLNQIEPAGSMRRYASVARGLFTRCRSHDANVVILVDTILFAFCAPWSRFVRSQFVCWEHFNLTTNHGSRFRALARWTAVHLSDAIVVLTERDAEAWSRKYRATHKVKAIWNPIPRFPTKIETLPIKACASHIVLAVGRLTHQKGFDLLLSAWHRLGQTRTGWVLRIVGGGEDEIALKTLARVLGIEDSVVFTGQVRDVTAEYEGASLYVMSSRWEGLPMTLLEVQHFGLPSVSADCPTGPREVLSGGSGLLVKPEDPQALADGLASLMVQPALRAEMAKAARMNAQRYNPEGIYFQWMSMIGALRLK